MRVCVVGCGAIGSLYAAHLAAFDDVEVWAYDVNAEHVAAINRDGLRLTGAADVLARVHARTEATEIPPCALGITATKARFNDAAMAATAHVFADGAVCSLQNGLGSEEVVAAHAERVIRGVCLPAGHLVAPGVVNMDAPGTTWIGPFEPQPARADEVSALADALHRSGMETVAMDDARGAQWTKLLFNAATNPLAALTGLTHGQVWERLEDTVTDLVEEGLAVADAQGITLLEDPIEMIARAARENYAHKPSMLQDVLARRPTEIGELNGGIIREGARVGVATPSHATIAALVRGLETSW